MRVSNEVYKSITIDWENITFPLKEGSPISPDGIVTNDKRAIGLIPTAITKRPLMDNIYILTGGDVIISDVEKAFGEELSTAAMSNMYGIRFYYDDGNVFHSATEGGGIDSWADIQHHVRSGDIENYLLAGDVVVVENADSETSADFEVEGIDEECPANASAEHVLSIVRKDVLEQLPFDPAQFLFAVTEEACDAFEWPKTGADAGMPVGTYNITLLHGAYDGGTGEDGTYEFTTTKIVPIGGGIRHTKMGESHTTYAKSVITGGTFTTYKADRITTLESGLVTTEGSTGTDLGTATCKDPQYKSGDYINFTQRQMYGSNRWKTSFLRQVLNSKEEVVQFVPGTIWSRPHSSSVEGFLHMISDEIVSVLGKVKKRYALPIADGYGYEDLEDMVTLVTMLDLGSGKNNSIAEGPVDASGTVTRETAKSLWKNVRTANADRIKRDSTATARHWWLSSTIPSNAFNVRFVSSSGALYYNIAYGSFGVVPVLHII